MFKTGLASVTFRKETPERIIELVKNNGLSCIEWGGDVHVPAGDLDQALKVRDMTATAGLQISSYGSYYKAGISPADEFDKALKSAAVLGAPAIRVWAGASGSNNCPPEARERIASDLYVACNKAGAYDIDICLECHPETLTDRYESSVRLLEAVNSINLKMYWQPNQFESIEYNIRAARILAPFCKNIHVFHWDSVRRYPLGEGKTVWEKYLPEFKKGGNDFVLLLEFMHDDQSASLSEAARALLSFIKCD